MASGGHRTTNHFGRRWGLEVELGCLLCWFAATSVTAQDSESVPVVASLSVATVPAEVFRKNLRESTNLWAIRPTERPNGGIIEPHRALTDSEAWEKFEAEYRPPHPSSSTVMHQLESAKYSLDVVTFGFDRLVRNIQDNTLFKFDQGGLRHAAPGDLLLPPASDNPWTDGLKNVRVKLDVKPRIGQPYVGVRVIIPFGN